MGESTVHIVVKVIALYTIWSCVYKPTYYNRGPTTRTFGPWLLVPLDGFCMGALMALEFVQVGG